VVAGKTAIDREKKRHPTRRRLDSIPDRAAFPVSSRLGFSMRIPILILLPLALVVVAPAARADLTPDSRIGPCYDKKAGDVCQAYTIDPDAGFVYHPGTCVEAKLDHLPLKRKAHLLCIVPPEPAPSASAAPSAVPPTPSASASPPAPSSAPPPEPQKSSGGCAVADPGGGLAVLFVLALGLFRGARFRSSRLTPPRG
jgi:hypothetical protein